jgi:hypothetical protein
MKLPWRKRPTNTNSFDGFEQRIKDMLDQRLLDITNITAHIFDEAKCKIFNRVSEIESKLPIEAKVLQAIAERETALLSCMTNVELHLKNIYEAMNSDATRLDELTKAIAELASKKAAAPPHAAKPSPKKAIKKPSRTEIKPNEKATK